MPSKTPTLSTTSCWLLSGLLLVILVLFGWLEMQNYQAHTALFKADTELFKASAVMFEGDVRTRARLDKLEREQIALRERLLWIERRGK